MQLNVCNIFGEPKIEVNDSASAVRNDRKNMDNP